MSDHYVDGTGDGVDAHEPLVVTSGVDVRAGLAAARGDHVGAIEILSFLAVSASAPDTLLHLVVHRDVRCMPSRQCDCVIPWNIKGPALHSGSVLVHAGRVTNEEVMGMRL